MSKLIKVKVTVTLNVDAQAWQNEFHIGPQSVREDVQGYFANICRQQLELLQCEAKEGE